MKPILAVGLMSGTSLDGIDAVLIRAEPRGNRYRLRRLARLHLPYSGAWREAARAIAAGNDLAGAARFSARWADRAAGAVHALAGAARVPKRRIHVIGAHGQTVLHRPRPVPYLGGSAAFSVQLADLSRLALRTGITTVGNFRTADLAAGGQGAPLVPAAHRILFGDPRKTVAVQNLGGIGNVTLLRRGRVATAFDTGPGNIWVDTVVRWRTNGKMAFDRNGRLAERGTPNLRIVNRLLGHPYFRRPPPKSGGWEEFGPAYMQRYRAALEKLSLPDAVATVARASVEATVRALGRFVWPLGRPSRLIVAGGGAKNRFFMEGLRRAFPKVAVSTSETYGIPVEELEAICFALLAIETLRGRPSNEPAATGARRPVICGQIAPGDKQR